MILKYRFNSFRDKAIGFIAGGLLASHIISHEVYRIYSNLTLTLPGGSWV